MKFTTIDEAIRKGYTEGMELITDSQNVEKILISIGKSKTCKKHDIRGLFVLTAEGQYKVVYGFKGDVPNPQKSLVKLK